jgi:hypothetical protein
MTMNHKTVSLTVVTLALAISAGYAATPVGLFSKVILDVTRKEAGKTWQKATRGQTLSSGDIVRTGVKSLAVIKFKDNSLVRLRERSELTVTGTVRGSTFSKSVEIQTGVIGFSVEKQKAGEEFRFTSPTSVASIRGTIGVFLAAAQIDTVVMTDGGLQLTNRISSRSVEVRAGFTGISARDGTIFTRPSTAAERRLAQDAQRDQQSQSLEIDLQGRDGKSSRLRIEYND